MSKRKRGDIAKEVRNLCSGLYSGKITDAQFEEGAKELLLEHGGTGFILQGIGLALHRVSSAYGSDFEQRVWGLADQVDNRIRGLYDNWWQKMQR